MKHERDDYKHIQDYTYCYQLAELILSMNFVTEKGLMARSLARQILGIEDLGCMQNQTCITTNGKTRFIPIDEPVFLIRGQDVVSGDTVRAWADLAEKQGADEEILKIARNQAMLMDKWPKKKIADLPYDPAEDQTTVNTLSTNLS